MLWGEGLEGILVGHLGALGGGEGEGDLAILRGEGKRSLPFHPQKLKNTFTAFFTKSCPVAILECQGDIFEAEVLLSWLTTYHCYYFLSEISKKRAWGS